MTWVKRNEKQIITVFTYWSNYQGKIFGHVENCDLYNLTDEAYAIPFQPVPGRSSDRRDPQDESLKVQRSYFVAHDTFGKGQFM